MVERITIRMTGDSGDGIQLVGEQLTITAALSGRDVRTLPDFPAEIRAPAGTLAGVSGFQLSMADHAVFTAGESLDVLVALNPAALKQSIDFLNHGGLLILNEDSLQAKEFEKAKVSASDFDDLSQRYQVLTVPLVTQTVAALKGMDLSASQAKKAKNFYVLGLVLWLFELPIEPSMLFIEKKFKRIPQMIAANQAALNAGYSYAMTLELSRQTFQMGQIKRAAGEYRQLTGVEAIGLAIATVSTMTQTSMLVSGYPITPASGILAECAKLDNFGVRLFQAEDEIAAICACLGAAFGGGLSLTCTSGPGMDLKSEALGLAISAELPLVVLDVQRAGLSTGLPTKTGQSDLRQAMYGRHGEAPLPVLAAQSPSDCFNIIIEAFTIAVRYMTPVIVLLDAYLVNAAEPWEIVDPSSLMMPKIEYHRFPKPYSRDEYLSRSWNIPGVPGEMYPLGGLEKQGEEGRISYDPKNHEEMVNLRFKKVQGVRSSYAPLQLQGEPSSSILVIGWGSTYELLMGAFLEAKEQNCSFALLHLRYLYPFHPALADYIKTYQRVFVVELNSGQLCQLLRAEFLVNAESITACSGQPFTIKQFMSMFIHKVHHES